MSDENQIDPISEIEGMQEKSDFEDRVAELMSEISADAEVAERVAADRFEKPGTERSWSRRKGRGTRAS